MGVLRRKMAEERAGFGQAKGQLAAAKAARRHSESQASKIQHLDLILGIILTAQSSRRPRPAVAGGGMYALV